MLLAGPHNMLAPLQHPTTCAWKQILHCRRMARKAMQLPDGRGTSVFDFPEEVCISLNTGIMQSHIEAAPC